MTEWTAEAVIERCRKARDRRTAWEPHWRECYDYALPLREGSHLSGNPGAKRTDRLFDGTAPDAVDQLAASLLAQLTPPWATWFGLQAGPDANAEERVDLGKLLERTTATLRSNFDRSNFAVEMMLRPLNVTEGRLAPEKLGRYTDDLAYAEHNGRARLTLGDIQMVSASCWWDPAYGAPNKGDASVIAVVFTAIDGTSRLHAVRYLTHDPALVDQVDEATQQCQKVVAFAKAHHVPSITVESNGIGRFLPGLLRREFSQAGLACAVIEVHSRRNKDQRILEAFDDRMAAGNLLAHHAVFATPFVTELREWRPGVAGADDGLDAVAGCLLAEPVRLTGRHPTTPPKRLGDWVGRSDGFRAVTEFAP